MELRNSNLFGWMGPSRMRGWIAKVGLVASVLLVSSTVWGQVCPQWQQATISTRYATRMAYDSHREVTVLFGGFGGWFGAALDDTLEWDGKSWTWRATGGPQTRQYHAMAYDSKRNVTVLFGGVRWGPPGPTTYFGDTWEWDSNQWIQRSSVGPEARSVPGLAYDVRRGVTVLFGGQNSGGQYLNDTWEWNGEEWVQVSATGPSPRGGQGLAFDSGRGVTVHFGMDYDAGVAETWEWNGVTWKQLVIENPPFRYGHAMAYDTLRGVTVMHGGRGSTQPIDDTWEFDGMEWTQRTSSGVPRSDYGLAFDAKRGTCVAFGNYTWSGETMEWNGAQWAIPYESPGANCVAIGFHEASEKSFMLVEHGAKEGTVVWKWDGHKWMRDQDAGFSSLSEPAFAYDSNRGVLVLTGTMNSGVWHDTWEFDGAEWLLTQTLVGPSNMVGPVAFDSVRGVTVFYSGTQTWEWNGKLWSQRQPTSSPPPRSAHSMAFDPIRQRCVMSGGHGNGTVLRDTWEWDGVNWNYLAEHDSVSSYDQMYYDSEHGRIRRCHVHNASDHIDTYEWTGSTWTLLPLQGPPHQWSRFVLAFDTIRHAAVMYNVDVWRTFELSDRLAHPGDITCDGVVNVNDLLAVINSWGPCPVPPQNCVADIAPPGPPMGDGVVNVNDLLMVINNWG